jgi:hypothetical protein
MVRVPLAWLLLVSGCHLVDYDSQIVSLDDAGEDAKVAPVVDAGARDSPPGVLADSGSDADAVRDASEPFLDASASDAQSTDAQRDAGADSGDGGTSNSSDEDSSDEESSDEDEDDDG